MHHDAAAANPAKRARRAALWLTTLLAAASLALGGAQTAAAAPPSGVDHQAVPAAAASAAQAYWSPARMRAAVDADRLVAGGNHASARPVESGEPTALGGRSPRTSARPSPSGLAPIAHIGKVFFTLGGVDYVCSGNSVVAVNERAVSTAAHCVNEGPGAYAINWVFAPAYNNGQTPYGLWPAFELHAPTAWVTAGDINYDTAFAVVSSPVGSASTLADTVGASGVAFNQPRGLSYTAYGYPAARPFNGQTLQSCAGTASADVVGGTSSQGITCDMTGGSSGGPWFIGSGSAGMQNSLNSFGYRSFKNTMFGPYWGSVVQATYEAAQS